MPLCLRAATTGESTSSILTPVCEVVLFTPYVPSPPQILRVILSALMIILNMAGPDVQLIAAQIKEAALDKIEQLQHHMDQNVFTLAHRILDKYIYVTVEVHHMLTTITLFISVSPSFPSLPPGHRGLITQVRCY